MRIYDFIREKRMGHAHTPADIRDFIRAYTVGEIPDYQASAWLMAVCLCGMNGEETAALTDAMMHSGDTIDLSEFGDLSVDKHSTGGVGDKTTLILSPIVASLGAKVAKMSGRALGHTGGTIDKLESIPGYRTSLSREEFLATVRKTGVAVIGQNADLAPADKKLYALRDVTGTVESAPLIASSIMSKKLAAGAHSIVLDVKVGSGAFMKTREDGEALARMMVDVGRACGRRVTACLSNMDLPLGLAVGNALEVAEAAAVLRGEGPADLREICLSLASEMLALTFEVTPAEAKEKARAALADGRALEVAEKWIAAQGGDFRVLNDPTRLPSAPKTPILAVRNGYIHHMNAEAVGTAAMILGAGRRTKEEAIDPGAGIVLAAKTGDLVKAGEPLAYFYTNRPASLAEAEAVFRAAVTQNESPAEALPLVLSVIR